ncbi:hypothetical protein KAR91_30065, partial [Candidatus Pacearchaeota archaeon]|nr:hypothetical protein [Candidatus Pacearchaeota archaeon]
CQLFLNLPSGSYNNSSSALLDASKYINKRLPIEYKGTAVSLYGITLQNSGGNIKIVADGIEDLREDAGTVGGEGGTGGVTSYDELDDTPPSKVGSSLKFPRVNVGESAHEYVTMTSQIGYDGNTKIITSADSLAVKIQRGSGSDTDNVLEILNGAGSVVGEIDGNGDLDVSDITLANNSILNLATLAPGLNTHAEYFIGHGASATWPVSMSTIYDANYVDHYLLMGGVLDGGTKAAPTAAGAPAGGGGYIGMVNLGTLSNSYLDLGRYSSGAGQSLNSILKLFGSGAAIFSDAIEADAYGTTVQTLTETAGAVAWDVSSGAEAGVTIDETSVITITNIPSTGVVYLGIAVTQGDAGDDNVTFVASGYSVFWRDDDQDLSDASGVYDEISLKVVGTKISVTWGGPYVAQ